ncbi:MAG: CPBP family intramembrane metalloprotease [Nitrospirae bacterium]|nr:CPBP family intramembrane metalloprotease [Nitrospirota bacterium]
MNPLLVYAAVVGTLKILYTFRGIEFIGKYLHVIALVLFLYTPLLMIVLRKATAESMGLFIGNWIASLRVTGATCLVVFVPFVAGFYLWHRMVLGHAFTTDWGLPDWTFMVAQFAGAALPEEVFYRGYLQSSLNRAWPGGKAILGARVGRGLILTSVLFALGHVIIEPTPVRFGVFFPSLIFGWLQERTGSVLAPVLFHGVANILMATLQSAVQ